jgi:hypothetical protein
MCPKKKRVVKRRVRIDMEEEYEDGSKSGDWVEIEEKGRENRVRSIKQLGKLAERKLIEEKAKRNE